VHPAGDDVVDGAGAAVLVGLEDATLQAMPFMIQPPLQQTPPPSAANGSGVEQVDVVGT
jgi:hypothetical protein